MSTVLIALLLSLSANGLLIWNTLELRDVTVALGAQADNAIGAAKTCSDSVDKLELAAATRAKSATAARTRAAASAASFEQRADETLSTPAAIAGNDCKSAEKRIDSWLNAKARK